MADVGIVTVEQLQALAATLPTEEPGVTNSRNGQAAGFDLEGFIRDHLQVHHHGSWKQGGYRWILAACPFNSDHGAKTAWVSRQPGGAIAAGCQHYSCTWKWAELRGRYEPRAPGPGKPKSERAKPGTAGDDGQGEKPPQASVLLQLAADAYDLGQTPTGEPFAVPKPGQGPHVARLLRGRGGSLRAELARRFAAEHDRAPSQQALADAMLVLQGRCLLAAPVELALRVARHGPGVVLDLGDETGRAVAVTQDGWQLVDRSPVLFRRTELTGALPEPVPGGDATLLRPLVNVDDDTWPLLVAWELSMLLRPGIPHPVPAFTGEHGTAKTAAMWVTARWLDPSAPQTRQAPRDVEAWTVAAAGSMAVAIDNLSGIPDWLSDAICRAVTGDGLVRRALYTDDGLAVLSFRRCVLLAGIAFAQLRGDLADRLLPAECERIDDERRLEDADTQAVFEAAWPSALGGLLDLAVKVLAALPDVKLTRKPRMADFARVVAATDQVLDTAALDTYLKLRQRTAEEQLEGDLVADAVKRFAFDQGRWEGTAGELLAAVTPERPPKDWPSTPRAMAARLKRAAPTLRMVGVKVERLPKQHGARVWLLERVGNQPPPPPQPPPDGGNRRSEPPSAGGGSGGGSASDHSNRPQPPPGATSKPAGQGPRDDGGGGKDGGGGSAQPLSDDPEPPTGGRIFTDTAAWAEAGRPGLDPGTTDGYVPARCDRCGYRSHIRRESAGEPCRSCRSGRLIPETGAAVPHGTPAGRVSRCDRCGQATAPAFTDMTGFPHKCGPPSGRFQPVGPEQDQETAR